MIKEKWTAALRAYAAEASSTRPPGTKRNLSEEDEWQRRIIGGDLIQALEDRLPRILQVRSALLARNFDRDPAVVFTTNDPGLIAASQILPADDRSVVCLGMEEFVRWKAVHPDEEFRFHIHLWSTFQNVDAAHALAASAKYPRLSADDLRFHVSGELWGSGCGHETRHLWQWRYGEMDLVEEAFVHYRY